MLSDRITEEADWKDGMNAFRLSCWKELEELREKVIALENKISRSNNGREDSETT